MVKVKDKQVRAALAEAQQRLERSPNGWPWLEAVGRCLRWLQDPRGGDYLRRAATAYPLHDDRGQGQAVVGNLYRLANDYEQAQQRFEQAYTMLSTARGAQAVIISQRLEVCFLVRKYDEVEALAEQLRGLYPKPNLRAYPIARLARARRTHDAGEASTAAEELAKLIRDEGAKIWDTGGFSVWDWYELALEAVQVSRSGDASNQF